jgi:hypothetical protein
MLKVELVPTLSQCIETVARKEYERIVRRLLASAGETEDNQKLVDTLGLLKDFLETADFRKLRAESERYLVEGRGVKFTIYAGGKVPKYEMQIMPE